MMKKVITIVTTAMMIMMIGTFKTILVTVWCISTRVDVYIFKQCVPTNTLFEVTNLIKQKFIDE